MEVDGVVADAGIADGDVGVTAVLLRDEEVDVALLLGIVIAHCTQRPEDNTNDTIKGSGDY